MAIQPILVTKIHIPPPGKALVNRGRLFQKLNQSLSPDTRLVLLSAPAGYGKTTLLSSWIRQKDASFLPVWLSLDFGDNDPMRFWSYLVSAIQAECRPDVNTMVGDKHPPIASGTPSFDESFLITLLNHLAQTNEETIIVLDDYHFIQEPVIHKNVWFLIERLPEHMHLAILTRSDPPFPIARLRGRGQVLEIRQEELCFQEEEAKAFLNECLSFPLAAEDIRLLHQKTEGWASGLQLAAASIQGHTDPQKVIRSFSGSSRFILDYLVGEVLENQPPTVRNFLLRTSVLEEFTASLCQFVMSTGIGEDEAFSLTDGQDMLRYLERTNLFIVALDEERTTFRYHHLFADLLQKQLNQISPELCLPLHRRASLWFEQHGWYERAINHAITGQDYRRAAALLSNNALYIWRMGEYATLSRLIQAIPAQYLEAAPQLYLTQALLFYSSGHLPETVALLEKVESRIAQGDLEQDVVYRLHRNTAILRTMLAAYRGDVEAAQSYLGLVEAYVSGDRQAWLSDYAITRSLVLLVQGEIGATIQQLLVAIQAGKEMGTPNSLLIAAPVLIWLYRNTGKTQQASDLLRQTFVDLKIYQIGETPIFNGIYIVQASLLLQQGDIDQAEAIITPTLRSCLQQHDITNVIAGWVMLAHCQVARRNYAAAEEALMQAQVTLQDHDIPVWKASEYSGLKAWTLIEQNKLEAAQALLLERNCSSQGQVTFLNQNEYFSLALLLIKQRHFPAADKVLKDLTDLIEHTDQFGLSVGLLILRALWYVQQKPTSGSQTFAEAEALRLLDLAMDQAVTYRRFEEWMDLDDALMPLLKRLAQRRLIPDPVRWRLGQPSKPEPTRQIVQLADASLVEPLSRRELEVLRLVGEGLSNKAIAERLHVTLQTVKFHTNQIYAKLQVSSRTQAIARAQSLGIL